MPPRSAAVYSGFTSIPSGVFQTGPDLLSDFILPRSAITCGIVRLHPLPIVVGLDSPPPGFICKIPADGFGKGRVEAESRCETQFRLDLSWIDGISPVMSRPVFYVGLEFRTTGAPRRGTLRKSFTQRCIPRECGIDSL